VTDSRGDGKLTSHELDSLLHTDKIKRAAMTKTRETKMPDVQLYRDVFNASPVGIVVENLDGQLLFVNPAFCSLLGFSEEELRRKHCVDFSPPEDAQKDWTLFQQLRTGLIDHYQLEKRYFRRDGSLMWGRLSLSLLTDRSSPLVIAMVEDITDKRRAQDDLERERQRSEESLRESEERLRLAAQAGRMFAYSWDVATDLIERSGESSEILGVAKDLDTGAAISALVHPDDKQRLEYALGQLTADNPTLQITYRIVRPDGAMIWLERTSRAYFDEHGKLKRTLGMVVDITQKKGAEKALRASEERLRLAQQAARMGSFEWNIRTGESSWTPELEAIYGLPPSGVSRTRAAFEDLVCPDDRARVNEFVDQALKTGRPTKGEWRVIWPDGSVHWIAGRAQVLMDESGEPSRMVGVNVDITERKSTEEKLREYERAVEGSEEMIIVIDRQYRYLIANRQFLKRHRMTREEVVGHFVYELANDGVFEAVFKPKLDECFQGKVVRFELKYAYPELGERDLSISYFPVEGSNGIDRAACVLQDVTDRKHAEQALAGMTRKLIEAEEQERARIGRELHDDVTQRLAMLAIQLEQLQSDPSEIRTRLQELQRETIAISSDVQALSHELHSAKLEYLGIGGAMKSWCKEFGERQKVEIDFKNDVSRVLRFETGLCLFRVLQEALHNAVKHSGAKQIEVRLTQQPNTIDLSVSDSGRGFDVESAMLGHGLGLTSMRERVRLVNGTIRIESKPVGGTRIHVCLPLQVDLSQTAVG